MNMNTPLTAARPTGGFLFFEFPVIHPLFHPVEFLWILGSMLH